MTIVYLIRHSEPLKFNNINNKDNLQVQNEKWPLTKNGEKIAEAKSLNKEFSNIDIVYSSNYVRAISTAKYFTDDKINIDEDFGERKFGIDDWNDLPQDFGEKQFDDFDYKLPKGESLNDVKFREIKALNIVLNSNKDKKIIIVGHSTAFASLLSNWCDISYDGNYTFNNKVFFNGKWDFCESFKLEFDENNNLVDIVNL